MIRFIDLGRQYYGVDEEDKEFEKSFAFINTVTDRFVDISGNQFWGSKEDFIEDYKSSTLNPDYDLDRFLGLIPENFNSPLSVKDIKKVWDAFPDKKAY